jgi:hypothetical protein
MPLRKIQSGGAKCPPGVLCMSPSIIIFLVLAIIIGLVFLVLFTGMNKNIFNTVKHETDTEIMHANIKNPIIQPNIRVAIETPESRFSMAPQPLRDLVPQLEYPPRGGQLPIPVGIPTRGLPESFQTMGVVKLPDGNVLPLYGRRTATSSDYFNYYTRTDTFNPVQLPLTIGGRDCMDNTGCKELMDGDKVSTINGQNGSVTLYKYNGPTYIPGLL